MLLQSTYLKIAIGVLLIVGNRIHLVHQLLNLLLSAVGACSVLMRHQCFSLLCTIKALIMLQIKVPDLVLLFSLPSLNQCHLE